jgi:hypothetical protein
MSLIQTTRAPLEDQQRPRVAPHILKTYGLGE